MPEKTTDPKTESQAESKDSVVENNREQDDLAGDTLVSGESPQASRGKNDAEEDILMSSLGMVE